MQRGRDIHAGCQTIQHDSKANARYFTLCFGNCRMLAYKISAYEVCTICPKLLANCKIHCKSLGRWPDGLTTLFYSPWSEINIGAGHVGCGRMHQSLLLHVTQIFQRRKSDANKQDFEIKLNFTYQAWSTSQIIGILTKVFAPLTKICWS